MPKPSKLTVYRSIWGRTIHSVINGQTIRFDTLAQAREYAGQQGYAGILVDFSKPKTSKRRSR